MRGGSWQAHLSKGRVGMGSIGCFGRYNEVVEINPIRAVLPSPGDLPGCWPVTVSD